MSISLRGLCASNRIINEPEIAAACNDVNDLFGLYNASIVSAGLVIILIVLFYAAVSYGV